MEPLEIKAFGFEMTEKRNLFHLSLSTLTACPIHLPLYSPQFTLFLACESSHTPTEVISEFAEKMLNQRTVYVCTWGPDCERVHDIFDETIVEHQMKQSSAEYISSEVMTTWHSNETLEDALDFFLNTANSNDACSDLCKAAIAISISNKTWATKIDDWMLSQISPGTRTYIYSSSSNRCSV